VLAYAVYKSGCELAVLLHSPHEAGNPRASHLLFYDLILKKPLANICLATLFAQFDGKFFDDFSLAVQCIDVSSDYQFILFGGAARSKHQDAPPQETPAVGIFHLDQHRSLLPACQPLHLASLSSSIIACAVAGDGDLHDTTPVRGHGRPTSARGRPQE
jgi:hypothetical protein